MGEMDTDLMGAAGPQLGPQEAGNGSERRAEPLLDPVVRHGHPAAAGADRHALAVDRMAADGGLDGALLGLGAAPDQGLVDAGEVVGGG